MKEQKHINPMIIKLSKETGIPLVATNDCHYIKREDHKMHEVLLCIQTNHTLKDDEDTISNENTYGDVKFERKIVKFNNKGYKVQF